MSHCFCFMLMSRSLVSSRISSRVRKCVSPFWCLVWELKTETHTWKSSFFSLTGFSWTSAVILCLTSNCQGILHSLKLCVFNRWYEKMHTLKEKSVNLSSAVRDESDSECDRSWLPLRRATAWQTSCSRTKRKTGHQMLRRGHRLTHWADTTGDESSF